jgi:hypothetical protein
MMLLLNMYHELNHTESRDEWFTEERMEKWKLRQPALTDACSLTQIS